MKSPIHACIQQSNEANLTFVGLVESLCPTLQGPGSFLYLTLKGFYLNYKRISDFIPSSPTPRIFFITCPTPRSNQINIGLKCLPPVLSLRKAITTMDDSRISRDGLEKLQALSVKVENNPGRFCF